MTPPLGTLHPEQYLVHRTGAEAWAESLDLLAPTELALPWGDNDANAHISNTQYFRYLEAGRISAIRFLTGGKPVASGKGVGMILSRVSNKYIRPVVAPDHIMVGHRVLSVTARNFTLQSLIYSYSQQALVSIGEATMATYDYDALKAIPLPAELISKLNSLLAAPVAKL